MKCLSSLAFYLTLIWDTWSSLPSFPLRTKQFAKGASSWTVRITVRWLVKMPLRNLHGKLDVTWTTHSPLFCKISPSFYASQRLFNVQGTEEIVTSGNLSLYVQLQSWAISIICMVPFKNLLFIFCLLDLSKYVHSTRTHKEKVLSWNCLF